MKLTHRRAGATLLIAALILTMSGIAGARPAEAPFVDTAQTAFSSEIRQLAESGVIKGCNPPANTKFCPDEPVTRAQMASFLVRAFRLEGGPVEFQDVPAGNPHRGDIAALAAAGVTKGCNPPANTKFCPDEPVTRGRWRRFSCGC